MKVVGLLSGGKDSVYNLVHCAIQGHEPVAVASLGPPQGQDELDSYMYQTVGHSGLKVLADALDLPFFVRTIQGTAVNQRGEYGSRSGTSNGKGKQVAADGEAGDETEDLYQLLRSVKDAMPEVQGVSVGAILSNYQRVRVEHVCARLGLTPLAYLWERSQPELLSEMIAAGMESVLVKVAGAGLQVKHLGQMLAQMEPTLHKLNAVYDLHVCGEGGEYETFTVDCPLFKRRVLLDKTTTVVSDSSPFSTVAHLHLAAVSLSCEPKPDVPEGESWVEKQARLRSEVEVGVPPLLDEDSTEWEEAAREAYEAVTPLGASDAKQPRPEAASDAEAASDPLGPQARRTAGGWLYVSEVLAPIAARQGEIEDEVRACFEELEALLAQNDSSLLELAHLTVYLSPSSETMALFPRINAVYSTYFGTSPPTRACVAVPGSKGTGAWRVKLEGVARLASASAGADARSAGTEEERKALHVQSMSYWAPANIGPYSQSVTTGERMHIAGQIPLIPATLSLPPSPSTSPSSDDRHAPFSFHAALALQHLTRIVAASSSPSTDRRGPESVVAWLAPSTSELEWRRRVAACAAAWDAAHHGEGEGTPFVAVEAASLPRDAEVEWQAVWACPNAVHNTDDDDEDEEEDGSGEDGPARTLRLLGHTRVVGYSRDETALPPAPIVGSIAHVKAFYRPDRLGAEQVLDVLRQRFGPTGGEEQPAISLIPAGRLATAANPGGQHDAVFVLTIEPR